MLTSRRRGGTPAGSLLLLLCLLSAVVLPVHAGSCLDASDGPRIGLVLSGGGARGAAHVGVLEVLDRLRIPIHCIAGTSMGAVVGAMYALGLSAKEIRRIVSDVNWNRGFVDEFPRERLSLRRKDEEDEFLIKFELGLRNGTLNLPRGVIQGHSLHLLLKELVGGAALVQDFDQLPIPFRAVATDIEKAQAVALAEGDLATALQASMAIPGVFSPVELDGRLLVDGGVSNNLPISVVREMGADIIIAVDAGTPLTPRDELNSVVAILDQLTNVLTQENMRLQKNFLGTQDVYIRPDLGEYTATDFGLVTEIVDLGRIAAEQQSAELAQLSVAAAAYARYADSRATAPRLPLTIDDVQLRQSSRLSTRVLQSLIETEGENGFDLDTLNDSLNALHSTGLFERVSYRYTRAQDSPDSAVGIVVEAEEKTWGPNLIRFGFSLQDDFAGNNNFSVSIGYIREAFNAAGGDFRAVGQIGETPGFRLEYFQPLSTLSPAYLQTEFEHQQFSQGAFDAANQTGEFRTRRNELGFFVGRQFAHHSDLRVGLRFGTGRTKRRVGAETLTDREEFAEAAIIAAWRFDTLDSIRFPSRGVRLGVALESSSEQLGADENFDAVSVDALIAGKLGKNRLVGSLSLQTVTRNSLPVQKLFSRRGLLNFAGFNEDLQVGQHAGQLGLATYVPLTSEQIAALDFPVYLGASVAIGGVVSARDDINKDHAEIAAHVFVAADTPVGPAVLGIGGTRGQGIDVLLSLGVTF